MAQYNYDRLSAQDNSFLLAETAKAHMHVSSTLIYEAGPLRNEDGGIDFERIKRATEGYLHLIPRYRQKLHFIPLENHAVWVDDKHFSLDYHVRHTALPMPGSDEQLKQLSARIMAQPLDRARPLWETWIVEGLEGDRFAVITKIHHCMIDGSSGVDVAQIMMSTTPDRNIPDPPNYIPRPAPTRSDLLRDELWRRAMMPFRIIRGARTFARETEDLFSEVSARAKILWDMAGMGLGTSETPLNGPLTHHRKFDWHVMALDDVKAVRRGLDCSVNDVVLTVVTSAVREFLLLRGADPSNLEFKIAAPVSIRREEEKGQLGNRVSSWVISLPIGEADPGEQLRIINANTQELKDSNQALAIEMIMKVAEFTPSSLLSLGAQAVSGPINSIVTNVPGPQFPLYMQGAKLEGIFPQVPLMEGIGLGIALMSYDGKICWGFNANPDVLPDLDRFVGLIVRSFERVATAAGVTLSDARQPTAPDANSPTETDAAESPNEDDAASMNYLPVDDSTGPRTPQAS
ncbi:MAG: wax ester/triacylglycerol synthase family O-acyltransferase [Deltaproteobacteria bacterium]|nr:wax ester/triacylglycerol synthase family O-acyltransferase [Deltaproteobacteria bacterium]